MTNSIKQGVITHNPPDNQRFPHVQSKSQGHTRQSYVLFPYGIAGVAPIGNAVLDLNASAEAENQVSIPTNVNFKPERFPEKIGLMMEGERISFNQITETFSFYDRFGNLVIDVTKDHNITVAGDQNVTIEGDGNATIGGALNITVTGDANITAANATITTTGDTTIDASTVKITGDLEVDGDITDNAQTNPNNMGAMRSVYSTHTHPGDSGGTTGQPNQQLP